jgi:hypothetical protein
MPQKSRCVHAQPLVRLPSSSSTHSRRFGANAMQGINAVSTYSADPTDRRSISASDLTFVPVKFRIRSKEAATPPDPLMSWRRNYLEDGAAGFARFSSVTVRNRPMRVTSELIILLILINIRQSRSSRCRATRSTRCAASVISSARSRCCGGHTLLHRSGSHRSASMRCAGPCWRRGGVTVRRHRGRRASRQMNAPRGGTDPARRVATGFEKFARR